MKNINKIVLQVFFYTLSIIVFSICNVSILANNTNKKVHNEAKNVNESVFIQSHIDKLKDNITLNAFQEEQIEKLLKQFFKDRKQAEIITDKNQKINQKKLSYETYIISLDSLLTEAQRLILDRKMEERLQK